MRPAGSEPHRGRLRWRSGREKAGPCGSRRAPKAREARHLVAAKERGQRPERSGVAGVVGAELCPHEREQLLGSGPRPGSAPRSSDEGPFHHVRAEHFGYRMIDLGDQKRGLRPFQIGGPVRLEMWHVAPGSPLRAAA